MKRKTIIEQAQKWLGKNEKDGSFKEIIDIYNSNKPLPRGYKLSYTDSWCAAFVSAVAIKCGATNIIPIECSCQQMIYKAVEMGRWIENDAYVPAMGDIIMYDWDDSGVGDCTGWADHVGYVEKVDGNVITVIEGNYNDEVKRRTIKVNDRYIRGYIVPDYDDSINDINTMDDLIADIKALISKSGFNYDDVIKRLTAQTEQPKVTYYPKYTGTSNSIVDGLNAVGVNSSYANRTEIAKVNGIANYSGTATQNTTMLKLLKDGKLIKG